MKYQRKRAFTNLFFYILLFIVLFFPVVPVNAEQTIITMPSSEVLPLGDMLLKGSTSVGSFPSESYTSLTPSIIFGGGHGTEFSLATGTKLNTARNTMVQGRFGVKKVWFLSSATRLTTGAAVLPSFSQVVHPGTFAYAHLSQRIKKTRTSITAGGYLSGEESFLNTGGVMIGLEQVVLPNKLRLAIDWLSSQDSYGKMGVGFKYRPVPSVSVNGSVIIPNEDSDNIAFNISVSKFISATDNPIFKEISRCKTRKQL